MCDRHTDAINEVKAYLCDNAILTYVIWIGVVFIFGSYIMFDCIATWIALRYNDQILYEMKFFASLLCLLFNMSIIRILIDIVRGILKSDITFDDENSDLDNETVKND